MSPSMSSTSVPTVEPDTPSAEPSAPPTKFRFKSTRKRRRRSEEDLRHGSDHDRHKSSRWTHSRDSHSRRHHSSKPHKPSQPPDDPALYDDTYLPNARSANYLDPDTAFRESLFDAMADDEGAAFWEGVYGQPIHTYPAERVGPKGELERMSEDEYAAYVRTKMYEKTHQHIIEERERREDESRRRRSARTETERMEREKAAFEKRVEESLRKGERRRARTRWDKRWETYLQGWDKLKDLSSTAATTDDDHAARDMIPWPVESGKMTDLRRDEVERFFSHAPGTDLLGILKYERVRWHPDKIQQRFGGGQSVDETTLRAVTAVFQVVDSLWADVRG
ncbi:MAG: hypothetical protein M1833_002274 [Piccolia ochrophora]|nr:MAG: hypothetical protein M1833_002274 [Piccolia ochrophora]